MATSEDIKMAVDKIHRDRLCILNGRLFGSATPGPPTTVRASTRGLLRRAGNRGL